MADTKVKDEVAPEPSGYPYAWSTDTAEDRPLDGFLKKVGVMIGQFNSGSRLALLSCL